jgi:hypothetical protein
MMDPPVPDNTNPMDIDTGPKSILNHTRVKRYGDMVALATEEVKTYFTADFTFSMAAAGANSKLNGGNLHRLLSSICWKPQKIRPFASYLLKINQKHRKRVPVTQPFPHASRTITVITTIASSTFHLHDRNQVKIQIKPAIISKTQLSKIHSKIMPWLHANDICLRSSTYNLQDTVCIGWIMGAHPNFPSIQHLTITSMTTSYTFNSTMNKWRN